MVVAALSEPGSIPGRMWGARIWEHGIVGVWRPQACYWMKSRFDLTNGNLVCSRVWNIIGISDLAQLEACSAHNRKVPGSKPGVAILRYMREKKLLVSNSKNFHALLAGGRGIETHHCGFTM
jgi:hypothetical protein